MLTLKAFAKINLGLHVLRKREDGFHDLETVFLKVGWHDELTFSSSNSIEMTCSNRDLRIDDGNLCIQAARALALAAGCAKGVQIHLDKTLPFGAGLGGGSSDAALTLQACKSLWRVDSELGPLAAHLGSDVPFFLGDSIAFGEGKGRSAVGDVRTNGSSRCPSIDCRPRRSRVNYGRLLEYPSSTGSGGYERVGDYWLSR